MQFADGYTLDRDGVDALVGVARANGAPLTAPTLFGTSGNDSLNRTPNGDSILRLGGNDFLNGFGGADTLAGGSGDDYYFVDDVNDYVFEAPSAGIDSMNSTVTYTLPNEVENLYLQGTTSIDATSNSSAERTGGTREIIKFPAVLAMTTSTVSPGPIP